MAQILSGDGTVQRDDICLDALDDAQRLLARCGQHITGRQSVEQSHPQHVLQPGNPAEHRGMVDTEAARRPPKAARARHGQKHPPIVPIGKLCIHAIPSFRFDYFLCVR